MCVRQVDLAFTLEYLRVPASESSVGLAGCGLGVGLGRKKRCRGKGWCGGRGRKGGQSKRSCTIGEGAGPDTAGTCVWPAVGGTPTPAPAFAPARCRSAAAATAGPNAAAAAPEAAAAVPEAAAAAAAAAEPAPAAAEAQPAEAGKEGKAEGPMTSILQFSFYKRALPTPEVVVADFAAVVRDRAGIEASECVYCWATKGRVCVLCETRHVWAWLARGLAALGLEGSANVCGARGLLSP